MHIYVCVYFLKLSSNLIQCRLYNIGGKTKYFTEFGDLTMSEHPLLLWRICDHRKDSKCISRTSLSSTSRTAVSYRPKIQCRHFKDSLACFFPPFANDPLSNNVNVLMPRAIYNIGVALHKYKNTGYSLNSGIKNIFSSY